MYSPFAAKRISDFKNKKDLVEVPDYIHDPEIEKFQELGLIELLRDLHQKENANILLKRVIKGLFSLHGYPIGNKPLDLKKELEKIGEIELAKKAEDGKYLHDWVYYKIDHLLIHK